MGIEENYFKNQFSDSFYRELQKARFWQLIFCKEMIFLILLVFTGLIIPYVVFCALICDYSFVSMPVFRKLTALIFLSNKAFEEEFSYAMVMLSSTAYSEGDDCAPIWENLYYVSFLKRSQFKKAFECFLQDLKGFAKKEKSLPFGKFAMLGDEAAFCPNKEYYNNK